VSAVVGVI